ncbi:MAG: copper-binding protein [Candidatus Methylomirabilales bacterium]
MNRSRYRNRMLTAALAISLCLLAIGKGFGEEFQGVGTVLALNPSEGMIALDHQEIPGLMPPMRMAFRVASPDLLKELKRGDRVQFTLKAEGSATVLTEITKIGGAALDFRDSMPKEIYAKLEGFGVTFIEADGRLLRKDGCPNIQRTLLSRGSREETLGTALFVLEKDSTSKHLIGVELRDTAHNPLFVWRSPDFWQIAACHFPGKYGAERPPTE